MSKHYVVIGAGFRGFCDSLQLLEAGHKVTIIDMAPFFGGISYSVDIKGFAVDKGVHMFDSIPQDLADIVTEIMDGQVRTIDFVSVSAFNKKLTDGYSLPDLASLDDSATKQKIKAELLALAKQGGSKRTPQTLAELLEDRYGKTAGGIYADIFKHVYNIEADKAQPDAISKTSLGRLKFLDDPEMVELKSSDPWLDSVLAARRKAIGKVDDLVSIYPDSGEAMRGWCDRAAKWLQAKGATVLLGQPIKALENSAKGITVVTQDHRIEADKVIWTNDNTKALAPLLGFDFDAGTHISGTPMIFATMITKKEHIKDFTYLQNFDPDGVTYRTASAGIYSGQTREDGASFITCECPANTESDAWKNAPDMFGPIWEECKALNIVAQEAELLDHHILRAPVTFKVAKLGYDEKIAEFQAEVQKRNPRLIFRDVKPFFRREIWLDSF
ncbi:MAG: NAD(P)-binding protein, partial [Alphaproteobacteria bacterium]